MDLTLQDYNDVLRECGCCETPRCCPPVMECRALNWLLDRVGWQDSRDNGSISDESGKRGIWYLGRNLHQVDEGFTIEEAYDPDDSGSEMFIASRKVTDVVFHRKELYSQPFSGYVFNGNTNEPCKISVAETDFICTGGGTSTQTTYTKYEDDTGWHNYASTINVRVFVISDNDESDSFDDPDHPRYCRMMITQTETRRERIFVDGGWVIQDVPDDPPDSPNPSVSVTHGFWDPDMVPTLESYDTPSTFDEFCTGSEEWLADNLDFSDDSVSESYSSDYCETVFSCEASKVITSTPFPDDDSSGGFSYVERIDGASFQYRFKLNKCCGYKRIVSAWRQIKIPQEYIDWYYETLALSDSAEREAATPPVDLRELAIEKQWIWEGTPPGCGSESELDTGGEFIPFDAFDDPEMWSPWSPVISYAQGAENAGVIIMRNFQQQCYEHPIPDVMPQVAGEFDLSDSDVFDSGQTKPFYPFP